MDEAYIGSLVLFAGNFAPRGWAFCDGSLLGIAQNQALFSLLGTTYGGNGTTNFALPDLRGRTPVHANNGQAGPGLPAVQLGEKAGANTTTLTTQQMPMHTHTQQVSSSNATVSTPAGNVLAVSNGVSSDEAAVTVNAYGPATSLVPGSPSAIGTAGGSQPLSLMQPYLGINYIICTQGIYPSRP